MKILFRKFFILPFFLTLGAGCSVTLAPAYDKALAEGLNNSAQTVMILLANISGGTAKETFSAREERYSTITGILDALKIQIQARPVPAGKIIDKANAAMAAKGVPIIAGTSPSAIAVENIVKNLVQMRNTDKTQGLTPLEVEIFKGNIVIYLDQAITYENFLKR